MFSQIRRDFLQIPKLVRIVLLLSLFFLWSGIMGNALVIGNNEGKMPVGTQKADMLFVIGPAQFGVTHFPSNDDFDDQHQALTEQTKFRILADRIPISLKFTDLEKLPHWMRRILELVHAPIGQEIIASLGDLFLCGGFILTLINPLMWLLWSIGKKILQR